MVQSSHGVHHHHVRKRIHQNHEQYPHPDRFKSFMDKAVYVVALLGPIMTLPQVFKIWMSGTAAGVSVLSWITYLFSAVFWLVYGILHNEKPIIVTNSLYILLDIMIIVGVFVY